MPITQTPNLALNKQDQSDEDWHIPLNENFDKLDFDFIYPLTYNSTTKEVRVERSSLYGGGTTVGLGSGTQFICPSGLSTPVDSSAGVEDDVAILVPRDGDLVNFYVKLGSAPGTGKSRTFTLRRNGEDTATTVTISDTDVEGNNTVASSPVAAGDEITIASESTGSPPVSTIRFGWELTYAQAES